MKSDISEGNTSLSEMPPDMLYAILLRSIGIQATVAVMDCMSNLDTDKKQQALEILRTYGECIKIGNLISTEQTKETIQKTAYITQLQRKMKEALSKDFPK
jgi:NurA-like 5'-3' nuclease